MVAESAAHNEGITAEGSSPHYSTTLIVLIFSTITYLIRITTVLSLGQLSPIQLHSVNE